jgi:hypothetical protein
LEFLGLARKPKLLSNLLVLAQGATRVDHMRRKLQTKVGAAIYSRRKTVMEPVFGQIKQARGPKILK